MIPAIILAAGASARMGSTKALLQLPGGDLFLSRLDATLRRAGIEEVVAVIGHDAAAIRAAVDQVAGGERSGRGMHGARLRLVENPDPSRGQLSSLLVGLDTVVGARTCSHEGAAGTTFSEGGPAAVLVTIVDLPLVSVETVRGLLGAWQRTGAPIVRPVRGGRHGHPVIFAASVFGELRVADHRLGARAVVRAHESEVLDFAVNDAGAFDDIDTPEDYERILRQES